MKVRTWSASSAGVSALGAVALCAACASAPPLDSRGLPRISRYTNAAQLDFLLERFTGVVHEASARGDTELMDQACLGYERTVFDLESLRRYPMIIRMSSDGAALVALRDELGGALLRHPMPPACMPKPAAQPAQDVGTVAEGTKPTADQALTPGDSAPAESGSPQVPGGSPPKVPAVRQFGPEASRERALLMQLRLLLRAPPPPGQTPESQPPAPPASIDEAALAELAHSDLPPIRLRARYHQMGRCVQLVTASDRYPTVRGGCAEGSPGEEPRTGQARLQRALLGAWRARYTEPLADAVVGLAGYASRDNPVTDGPRSSR